MHGVRSAAVVLVRVILSYKYTYIRPIIPFVPCFQFTHGLLYDDEAEKMLVWSMVIDLS
jgi:hypothetical protein